jgi:tetraacyldisaccharide 4'-kinase
MIALVPPAFWYQPGSSLTSTLLKPLSWLWLAAACVRRKLAKPYTSSIPVICVGNVMIGGTGKTPTAIALCRALGASRPCFLTRGYRSDTRGAVLVTSADARMHGDEAVLLSRVAPVIVSPDRAAGLRLAEKEGFDLVIADDGFQNPGFTKTASVLVFDGGVGAGNGACIPAGPLREKLNDALGRAHAAVIVGDDVTQLSARLGTMPVFHAQFETHAKGTGPYVAFAGIGRPQKFFDTLVSSGYTLAETVPFPDHHAYTQDDMDGLASLAARHNAKLITTEKDHVRLPQGAAIEALPVDVRIENMDALVAVLRRA